jgi:eukaryotic-like serine/threonine-protein kinase
MNTPNSIVEFLRKRDYVFVKVLGQGACGQTVLLRDEIIESNFVCKKYVPYSETHRQLLFKNFLREIKLLHEIYHTNVVRVFNYYVYPEHFTGYILMEFIDGLDIEDFVVAHPEATNNLFLQAVEGFAYLENSSILHRDIRPQNIMVRSDGTLKIIDLGFGKRVDTPSDFDKSISLNWWCELPNDFDSKKYDHSTEVYFVGKLFEKLILESHLENFSYVPLLSKMCQRDPAKRIASFTEVRTSIQLERGSDLDFTDEERGVYLEFADAISGHITKIEIDSKYSEDPDQIRTQLEAVYRNCMLEDNLPDCATVIRLFIKGSYYYRKADFPTRVVRGFLDFMRSASPEKRRVALANLHSRLDAISRYDVTAKYNDIPF